MLRTTLRGLMIWNVMQRNVWSDIASWPTKFCSDTESQLHVLMTISSKKKNWDVFENGQKVCSQIVLKCLYLARSGRPDIRWSADKLARSITKWTRACDQRLALLISYIHHTHDHTQCCHVGNTAQHCRLGLFQDSDFAGDLEDSKSTSGRILCFFFFGNHTFVPKSWTCKKHTLVSRRSAGSEIISLDAGLHMDGIPALTLCVLVIEVLHSSFNQTRKSQETVQGNLLRNKPSRKHTNSQTKTQIQHNDLELSNVDYVSSNVKSSHSGAMLYICEDNAAVIKMIIKGRSLTMRQYPETTELRLIGSWQDKFGTQDQNSNTLTPKNEFEDILTKGNFPRNEWNQLLHLSTLAISALPAALLRCRKERKKKMDKNELWQSQSRRWTCARRP